jgi:hypothetical protein
MQQIFNLMKQRGRYYLCHDFRFVIDLDFVENEMKVEIKMEKNIVKITIIQ